MKNSNTQIVKNCGNIVFNIYNAFGKIYPDKGWGARKLLVYETKIIWKCTLRVEKNFKIDDFGVDFGGYERVKSFWVNMIICYFNLLKLKEAFDDGILSESQLRYELTEPVFRLRELSYDIQDIFIKGPGDADKKEKLALLDIGCCLRTVDLINMKLAEAVKTDLKEEYLAAAD